MVTQAWPGLTAAIGIGKNATVFLFSDTR